MPNLELGISPGWVPIEDPENTFTSVFKRHGYWTAQVSRQPLHSPSAVRAVPQDLRSLGGDRRPVGRQDPRYVGLRPWTTGSRRSCATSATCPACASTWPTRRGVDEEQTCAARVYKRAIDLSTTPCLRQPFCMRVDCFDPHEPCSPLKKYLHMYSDPGYDGQEVGRHAVRVRAQLHSGAAPPHARRLRGRGHA